MIKIAEKEDSEEHSRLSSIKQRLLSLPSGTIVSILKELRDSEIDTEHILKRIRPGGGTSLDRANLSSFRNRLNQPDISKWQGYAEICYILDHL